VSVAQLVWTMYNICKVQGSLTRLVWTMHKICKVGVRTPATTKWCEKVVLHIFFSILKNNKAHTHYIGYYIFKFVSQNIKYSNKFLSFKLYLHDKIILYHLLSLYQNYLFFKQNYVFISLGSFFKLVI
jgi:hypothetical protein